MLRNLLITLGLGLLLTLCGTTVSAQTVVEVSAPASGAVLYAKHCAKCHRTLAKTSKPQRSVSRLRSSIRLFPAMYDLDFLTDEQLQAISAELQKSPLN